MILEQQLTISTITEGFPVVVKDGARFYKDQRIDTVLSYKLRRLIEDFLSVGEVEILLREKYNVKVKVRGSLEKLAAVRDHKVNDFDIVLVDVNTKQPVEDEILEKIKHDKDFHLFLLKFIATIDDPNTPLGRFFETNQLTLSDRGFDVLGKQIPGEAIIGFVVSTAMFQIRFGEPWDGVVEEPDHFERLAREIYEEVMSKVDH